MQLTSPVSGRKLVQDTANSLTDGGEERWPVVESIPYLRAGSRARASEVLACLDAGDSESALVLLLSENDDWWDEKPPPDAELRQVIAAREQFSLREVMKELGWGRVGDYFAHRWSDPTFAAGLALGDAVWNSPQTGFELCCGIGQYLRAWSTASVRTAGADVVWAKLWVAKNFILDQQASLICFDADHPWPVQERFDLVACHDAFYFLRNKEAIAERLRGAVADGGTLLVSHVHNSAAMVHSPGHAVSADRLAALFPGAVCFDDAELSAASTRGDAPVPSAWGDLGGVDAFSLAIGPVTALRPAKGPLSLPERGARLVRNPLITPDGIQWPSARYQEEYGSMVGYGRRPEVPNQATMSPAWEDAVLSRDLLCLPERW